jgi:hypothetical protein
MNDLVITAPDGAALAPLAQAVIRPAEDLTALATEINREHAAGEEAARRGLEHFRRAGEALLRAKAQCDHGKWLPWLRANVKFSQQTASAYMRLAEGWGKLPAAGNFTLREALGVLSEPPPGEGHSDDAPRAEVRALTPAEKEKIKNEIDEARSRPRKQQRRKGWKYEPNGAAHPGGPAKKDPSVILGENERREAPAGGAEVESLGHWKSSLEFHACRLNDLALQAHRLSKARVAERQVDDVRRLANGIRNAAGNLEVEFLGGPCVYLRRYFTAMVGHNGGSLEGLQAIPAEAWERFLRDDPGGIKRLVEGCEALATFLRTRAAGWQGSQHETTPAEGVSPC